MGTNLKLIKCSFFTERGEQINSLVNLFSCLHNMGTSIHLRSVPGGKLLPDGADVCGEGSASSSPEESSYSPRLNDDVLDSLVVVEEF